MLQDLEEEAALCGEERRQGNPPAGPLSRRLPLQLAEHPTPHLPFPPLLTLGGAVPPSPSKLPLAAGSLSPRAIQAPSSLADALLWLDGSGVAHAASAANSAAGSPAAAPLAPAEQVRGAFAAGQRRRQVSPARRERERRRLREEQADHRCAALPAFWLIFLGGAEPPPAGALAKGCLDAADALPAATLLLGRLPFRLGALCVLPVSTLMCCSGLSSYQAGERSRSWRGALGTALTPTSHHAAARVVSCRGRKACRGAAGTSTAGQTTTSTSTGRSWAPHQQVGAGPCSSG